MGKYYKWKGFYRKDKRGKLKMLIDMLNNEILILTEYHFNAYMKNYILDRLELIKKDKDLYSWVLSVLERLDNSLEM